jgi:hypothetical protein
MLFGAASSTRKFAMSFLAVGSSDADSILAAPYVAETARSRRVTARPQPTSRQPTEADVAAADIAELERAALDESQLLPLIEAGDVPTSIDDLGGVRGRMRRGMLRVGMARVGAVRAVDALQPRG